MATRKRNREEEAVEEMEKKRARMDDHLSNLPIDLKLRILSSLNSKHAVQTMLLSKTWIPLWTSIPVLEFNIANFNNIHLFDKFVYRVLSLRDPSAKLDRLTFIRHGIASAKILKTVFDYAFSHGVKKFEAYIHNSRNQTWPICQRASFESLKSLKLESQISINCPFLGPRSGSFKNLTDLYLRGALITNLEPFSGFPVLERLTMINCEVITDGKTLNLHALNLSELTISCYKPFNSCMLTTPRLRSFEYQGSDFPMFRTHACVPVLDTMIIGYNGHLNWFGKQEKRIFDDLLSMFCALRKAKSLTLLSSVVDIMCLYRDELANQTSPFRNLKCLKVDLEDMKYQYLFDRPPKWPLESVELPLDVKAYLLHNSPDANVTMIYPRIF